MSILHETITQLRAAADALEAVARPRKRSSWYEIPPTAKRNKMSAAGRRRISQVQQQRWAAWRKQRGAKK